MPTDPTLPSAANLWNDAPFPARGDLSAEAYMKLVMEQYKLYVQMADQISARRSAANTFFSTIHTAVLAFFGYVIGRKEPLGALLPRDEYRFLILLPLAGVLILCFVWYVLIRSYDQLNTVKFKVIGELEKRLPASPWWGAEWDSLAKGDDKSLYWPLTHLERRVPLIFAALYIIAAVVSIFFIPSQP